MQIYLNVKAEDIVSFGAILTEGAHKLALIEAAANHSLRALEHTQPMACTCGTGQACSACPTPEVHA